MADQKPKPKTEEQKIKTVEEKSKLPSAVKKIEREFKEKAVAGKAKELGLGYLDVEKVPINPDLFHLIPSETVKEALLIPFFRIGKKIRLALADPENPKTKAVLENLKKDGYLLNLNLASEESILGALEIFKKTILPEEEKKVELTMDEAQIQAYEKEIEDLTQLKSKLQEITSEEALGLINVGAIKTGASDIHFQPEENKVIVRFRIDGVLQKIFELDPKTYNYLSNQLKYKAKMRLNIQNEPQDGRYYFTVNQRKIDVRVSAIPTEFGESLVCRLLHREKKFSDFKELGFSSRNLKFLEQAIQIKSGMILVTGPTGCGKTTTLYAMLTRFNQPEIKIITLEDPIEYYLENITQSQVNEKRGYNFASGLRSILRQDPDVIMIGEIRDLETAGTAAQAALTGHVLLSTLHTNSAVETIPRLRNIGLEPFMIGPALHTILAQRLVRRICPYCRKQEPIKEEEKKELESTLAEISKVDSSLKLTLPEKLWHASGCEKCSHTGYLGQLAISEILPLDDELKDLILNDASVSEIFKKARLKGLLTIKEDGILKVLEEITTLEEIERVTRVV